MEWGEEGRRGGREREEREKPSRFMTFKHFDLDSQ